MPPLADMLLVGAEMLRTMRVGKPDRPQGCNRVDPARFQPSQHVVEGDFQTTITAGGPLAGFNCASISEANPLSSPSLIRRPSTIRPSSTTEFSATSATRDQNLPASELSRPSRTMLSKRLRPLTEMSESQRAAARTCGACRAHADGSAAHRSRKKRSNGFSVPGRHPGNERVKVRVGG